MRESSWDHTGGNEDFILIEPGATAVLADLAGAGCIQHLWLTVAQRGEQPADDFLRSLTLRAFWDGAAWPSILSPLGDFFTIEHGHDNHRSDDLSSVAHWYAAEPARGLTLPPVEQRMPRGTTR